MKQQRYSIFARLTAEELKIFKSRVLKTGMTQNAFIVKSVINSKIVVFPPEYIVAQFENQKRLDEIYAHVKRIGNNVNQIARKATAGEEVAALRRELRFVIQEAQKWRSLKQDEADRI